jgi:uncharacterized protein YwqG
MKSLLWGLAALAALALVVFWFLSRQRNPAQASQPVATAADADAFLAPARAALEQSRRPVLRIALEALPGDDLAVSKVGGRAWWPQGTPPPAGAAGEALVLLAQINFAEMPTTPGYPTRGLLQFFIAAKDDVYGASFGRDAFSVETLAEQRRFRVVYWPDPDVPAVGLPWVADAQTPHAVDQPRQMRFTVDKETLSMSDYRFDGLFAGDAYAAAENAAKANGIDADSLFDRVWERHSGAGHKLGGYPYFTQEDPRSGGDWELLLQLDSDDEMMWGDVGVANFFIAPADLARGDFSRVAYNWDCH